MDTPSSNSLLKPRLRLIRRTPSPRAQDSSDMDFTPVAVPSSARSQFNVVDDEDDNQPTPRMPPKNIASSFNSYGPNSDFGSSTSYAIPSDTPAARLRALLARSSDSPSGKSPPTRLFAQLSEDGAGSVSSRFTRDSLKDLFSHARREPGDTPQKSRPRRSSFDTSEMDITPVVDRERDKHKGKRKSLSDDEVDKPKSSKGSESSFRSSHAATFDTLRARLMSSHSQLLDQKLPTAVYDVTSQPSEIGSLLAYEHRLEANVNPTTTLLRPLDSSWLSPPRSAGSPHGTFQLPSQLVSHSNLLDQDSDMQHAMRDLDTSEDVPVPTPGPSTSRPSTTPLRPRSSLSYRGGLRGHDQSRRASLELPGPRASSSLSDADFKEKQHSRGEDRMHQREREWNRPKAPSRSVTPELHHRHSLEFHRRHSQKFAYSTPKANVEEKFKKGHRKRLTEFTESVGSIHPHTNMHGAFGDEDMVLASDEESVSDFAPRSTTPDPDDAPSETETEVLVSPPSSPTRQRSPAQAPPGVSFNDEARLHRALSSTSATSFRPPTPDYPLKTSRPQEQTMPSSFTPPGTPPLASIAPQDESSSEVIPNFVLTTPPRRLSSSTSILDFRTPSPPHDLSNLSALPSSSEDEVETREADVTPVRVGEGGLSNPNYTAMKTPKPPGAWATTPVPSKHLRETSPPPTSSELNLTAPSSSAPLSRAKSETEQSSKTVAPAGNGLLTPIPSLSRANSLPLRTPAPPGAWMSTPNQPTTQNGQNGSTDQSEFGSIGRRKSILKVRFDVAESEASTAEVEHQRSPLSSARVPAPDFLPDGPARRVESTPSKATNGFAQNDVIHDPVLARPLTPERPTTPVSRPNAPSPRSLRKSPIVKVVDAFGRERIDDPPTSAVPQDIANGRADANDAIRSSRSAEAPHTPRAQHKSNIRIVDAMGREIEEEAVPVIEPLFEEESSALHDDSPMGRTETLAQMRQTLREWADGLSDGDRSADDLALNTSHLEELEEVSRAARRARNQLAQTLCVESVKERDLMHKYAKDAVGQSGLLPAIVGDNSSFQRGLVLLGVMVQIIFVLAMWRFAHVQARRLFYTVYYDPLYPELNPLPGHSHRFSPPYPSFPWSLSSVYEIVKYEGWTALKAELQGTVRRIGEHAWERWGERPYTGTWPPT